MEIHFGVLCCLAAFMTACMAVQTDFTSVFEIENCDSAELGN